MDGEDRLVGIITVDDVMDVMEQEATEDFEKMAAMLPSEKPYLKTGVFQLARNRIPWLMILMLSSMVTGGILLKYENAFSVIPLLVTFIPMLMDTGGNSGSQASTMIIRGMAVGEVEPADILKVMWKRNPRGNALWTFSGACQFRAPDDPVSGAGTHLPDGSYQPVLHGYHREDDRMCFRLRRRRSISTRRSWRRR